jgi:hypothetical protein
LVPLVAICQLQRILPRVILLMVQIANLHSQALVGFIEPLLDSRNRLATRLHLMLAMQSMNCALGADWLVAREAKVRQLVLWVFGAHH